MEGFWTLGVIASLIGNIVLLLLVLGLARELGLVLTRMGPTRALPTMQGLELGTKMEPLALISVDGEQRRVAPSKSTMNLLLFTSPTCPVCEELLPALEVFSKSYRGLINVSVISKVRDSEKDREWSRRLSAAQILVAEGPEFHQRMQISSYPHAMVLDSGNVVVARGLVNSLEQLESLISIDIFMDRLQPGPEFVPVTEQAH